MIIHGVYLINFGINIGNEFNGNHYGIVISSKEKGEDTFIVVPITSKKEGKKYRGGFTIDNKKYQKNPSCDSSFALVKKLREVHKSRVIKKTPMFNLDFEDLEKLRDALRKMICEHIFIKGKEKIV